jgi:uncharacterized membrane protein YsdA (DUF1294 family)
MNAFRVAVAALAMTALLAAADLLPWPLPWLALLASLVTFGLYWRDKRAAVRGGWRTPESTLHLWALFGGWPGALWGQQRFRHKTSKREFRRVFWLTVALNVGAQGALMTAPAAPLATAMEATGDRLVALVVALPWRAWTTALISR